MWEPRRKEANKMSTQSEHYVRILTFGFHEGKTVMAASY